MCAFRNGGEFVDIYLMRCCLLCRTKRKGNKKKQQRNEEERKRNEPFNAAAPHINVFTDLLLVSRNPTISPLIFYHDEFVFLTILFFFVLLQTSKAIVNR